MGNMKDVMDRVMRVKVVVYTKEDEMCHDHVTDVRDVRDDEKDQLMKVIDDMNEDETGNVTNVSDICMDIWMKVVDDANDHVMVIMIQFTAH